MQGNLPRLNPDFGIIDLIIKILLELEDIISSTLNDPDLILNTINTRKKLKDNNFILNSQY